VMGDTSAEQLGILGRINGPVEENEKKTPKQNMYVRENTNSADAIPAPRQNLPGGREAMRADSLKRP
jgi:hypothetical protein